MTISKSLSHHPRSWALVAVVGAVLTLSACGDKSNNTTTGEKVDAAIARTEQAGAEAKAKVEQMSTEAKAKLDASTATGEMSAKQGVDNARAAIDDAAITASVSAGLAKDADLSAIKINVDTKAGVVSLKGPAPTVAAKGRAEDIAKAVKGVNSVDNQLEVKPM